MNKLNALITGCGGDIGQSIGKILKNESQFNKVIGCDIHLQHAGVFIFDKCFIVPKVIEPPYFDEINTLISLNNIDILIITSEPELRFVSSHKYRDHYKCDIIILPNDKALKIGFDKYQTAKFLIENNLPAPQTWLINESTSCINLPVIAKDRQGAGSKNLFFIENLEDLNFYQKKLSNYILQEYLPSTEGEFTCGIFRHGSNFRSIIFRRNLSGGFSGYGEVVENGAITNLLMKIAELLCLNGSINIQLRLVKGVPYVFEINPRFSSTVLFRHLMGFKDVIWAIEAQRKNAISAYIPPKVNSRFYKGFSEFISLEK